MFSRRLKVGYFILEGLNSFALTFYFSYFYFFTEKSFGFGNLANLTLAACNGALYAAIAFWAGKFGQRFGYFTALRLGFLILIGALATGFALDSAAGHIAVMLVAVVGMCFTWPMLEALVSEGETRRGLQHMVGTYNVVWAATAALAYFCGGALLEKFGYRSLFLVPVAIQLIQLGLTFWLESTVRRRGTLHQAEKTLQHRNPKPEIQTPNRTQDGGTGSPLGAVPALGRAGVAVIEALEAPAYETHPHAPATTRRFLRMAWLSNPLAYAAISTLNPLIPSLSQRLHLSTTLAGICCSVWYFARLGAFAGLWYWDGWHYRFRWLLSAYAALLGSFALILLVPDLAVLVLAQVAFGGALGLIYYSSLFYSMDLSETKSEHGGIHEAVIGLGNCTGPAVGAASLFLLPQYANSGAFAVCGLLLAGLAGLGVIWRRGAEKSQ